MRINISKPIKDDVATDMQVQLTTQEMKDLLVHPFKFYDLYDAVFEELKWIDYDFKTNALTFKVLVDGVYLRDERR